MMIDMVMKPKTSTYTTTIGGKTVKYFALGKKSTTPDAAIQNTETIEQIIDLADNLTEYERSMLGQWLSEIFE